MMTAAREQIDADALWEEWQRLVNMTPSELATWRASTRAKSVGVKTVSETASSYELSAATIEILRRSRSSLDDTDWAHMAKVVSMIRRQKAMLPGGAVSAKDWRANLMNFGHDPLKCS